MGLAPLPLRAMITDGAGGRKGLPQPPPPTERDYDSVLISSEYKRVTCQIIRFTQPAQHSVPYIRRCHVIRMSRPQRMPPSIKIKLQSVFLLLVLMVNGLLSRSVTIWWYNWLNSSVVWASFRITMTKFAPYCLPFFWKKGARVTEVWTASSPKTHWRATTGNAVLKPPRAALVGAVFYRVRQPAVTDRAATFSVWCGELLVAQPCSDLLRGNFLSGSATAIFVQIGPGCGTPFPGFSNSMAPKYAAWLQNPITVEPYHCRLADHGQCSN